MCKFAAIFLIFILGNFFFCGQLHAQDSSKPVKESKSTFMDDEHREEIYDERKKSEIAAVVYSLVLPGLGNFYTDQYFVGALFMSALVFAGFFAAYGFSSDQPEYYVGAGLLAGGAYIASPITAFFSARSHNENLRRALKVSLGVRGRGVVGFSFKTSF